MLGECLHLEYRDEEPQPEPEPPPLTRADLAALPAGLRQDLRLAAIEADHQRILELLEQHPDLDPGVAAGLDRQARGFHFQALQDLLPQGETP